MTIRLSGWDTSSSKRFLTVIAPISVFRSFSGAYACPDEENNLGKSPSRPTSEAEQIPMRLPGRLVGHSYLGITSGLPVTRERENCGCTTSQTESAILCRRFIT